MSVSFFTFATLETESPEETKNKLLKLGLLNKYRKNIVGSNRVVIRGLTLHSGKESAIPYKQLLKVSDLVDRVSISHISNTGNGHINTVLLNVEKEKLSLIDRVKTEDTGYFSTDRAQKASNFQRDYFYQKYDFKTILSHENIEYEYENFDCIEDVFAKYKDFSPSNVNCGDKTRLSPTNINYLEIKAERSCDLNPENSFSIDNDSLIKLLKYFREKEITLHSDSMQKNLIMSVSYKPDNSKMNPTLISDHKLKESLNDEETEEYIINLTKNGKSISKDYSNKEIFIKDKPKNGMLHLPNPKKADINSKEIHLNKKGLGETQCTIAFKGTVNLEKISKTFNFNLLFSFNWLSENSNKEIENIINLIDKKKFD